jgi:hypothetical protein
MNPLVETELRILRAALEALHRTTGLQARLLDEPVAEGVPADFRIEIKENGVNQKLNADVKRLDRIATVGMLKARMETVREPVVLVTKYITSDMAERCKALHLQFMDTAGNAYLRIPGLLVYIAGQKRPAELKETPRYRALRPAGLKIIFALLCQPHLLKAPYREIAGAATVALGAVGRCLDDLELRGHIVGEEHKRKFLARPEALLEEWVNHYPIRLRPKLDARRFRPSDAGWYGKTDLIKYDAFWSGEAAAEKLTKYLKPELFTVYSPPCPESLIAACRFRAELKGNIEILNVFWNFPRNPTHPDIVPPVLAYADLMATNDGRNIEAAKLIREQYIQPFFG